MHPTKQPERGADGLRRALGPLDAISVVIGAIVGVGIFFTPSRVAALVGSGPRLLVTWVVGGVIALLGALTFAELGRLYPRTGGQYEILRDAFGPAVGFVYVLCNASAIQAGAIAIVALVCTQNLALALLGALPEAHVINGIAAALILGLTAINAVGVRWGAAVQNVTVVAKLLTLLAVIAAAVLWGGADPTRATAAARDAAASESIGAVDAVVAIGAGLVPVLFSFGGWQLALWIAGEVRRPRRDVPLAILVGVGVVVTIYVLTCWAYLELLGHARVAASPTLAADAAAVAWGDAGRRGLAAAVAVSAFGVLGAQLLAGPRLVYAMARDGRFFRPFARLHVRYATPVPAIALLGGIALVLLLLAGERGVDRLLTGVVTVDGLFFALTALALPILRYRYRYRDPARARVQKRAATVTTEPLGRPFRGALASALLFCAAELAVVGGAFADPEVRGAAHVGLIWVALAFVLYAVAFRRPRPPRT